MKIGSLFNIVAEAKMTRGLILPLDAGSDLMLIWNTILNFFRRRILFFYKRFQEPCHRFCSLLRCDFP